MSARARNPGSEFTDVAVRSLTPELMADADRRIFGDGVDRPDVMPLMLEQARRASALGWLGEGAVCGDCKAPIATHGDVCAV